MQETWVQFLSQEDPLEEEDMATHSRVLGLGNPVDRGAWQAPLRAHEVTKSQTRLSNSHTHTHTHTHTLARVSPMSRYKHT